MNDQTGPEILDESVAALPDHVEESVHSVAAIHADHRNSATWLERRLAKCFDHVSRPMALAVLTAAVLVWMLGNEVGAAVLGVAPDPPPFIWMSEAVSLVSLYLVILILSTQRREDLLSEQREQLILQMSIVNEQKTAKMIELLETLRRDDPLIRDRVDEQADAMATPVDPRSVLDAIKETHAEMAQTSESEAAPKPP